MVFFAWLTFLTGLVLSGTAAYFSVFGLALIYAGAFWPVVILASVMECAKLVSVSWLFRYRHLASWPIRLYFIAATILLASITSMGIFGYLTRAHVETEGTAVVSQLALDEIAAREASLLDQRQQLNTELASLTQQSSQLLAQLGNAGRLAGASGAVRVQRESANRRQTVLGQLQQLTTELSVVRKQRAEQTAALEKATADIGPLKYVASAIYGKEDLETVRLAVVWLTILLMVVFDPMAIMLLVAANILFMQVDAMTPKRAAVSPPTEMTDSDTSTPIIPHATAPPVRAASTKTITTETAPILHVKANTATAKIVPLVPFVLDLDNARANDVPMALASSSQPPIVPFDSIT